MATTTTMTCVRLISGLLLILSIVPSEAVVVCHQCNYDSANPQLSNCHLPLDSRATPTCDGQFCQSILYTSPQQSVPTIYRSCIDLSSGITVEHCLQYSQALGITFFLFENQCCYSLVNSTGTYTHCFCQDDFCNSDVTQPVIDGRPNTSPLSAAQLEVVTQSPDEASQQRPSVTCYDCKYSVNASVIGGDSTCSEPFNPTGASTCSARACYNYAYVEEELYTVIRGCDTEGNFDFQSDEQCLQYGQIYNGTFFVYENQCCYTLKSRWSAMAVCYCHSDLCNMKVSKPVLAYDTLTTVSKPPETTFSFSTFLSTVVRNSTQSDPLLSTFRSKRYTPSISWKSTSILTKPTQLSPLYNPRATPLRTSLMTASGSLNATTVRVSTPFTPSPSMSSITCYNCSYYPNSESSADDSVCSGSVRTCTGRACYFYVYTSDRGISLIDRNCDKEGTVVFQSDDQCLQYSKVYNLTFFTFEHQCCYQTDVSGMPVTVCFCNTELCNSNRFRPMPQTATTTPLTTSTSKPVPDIPPSSHYNTTASDLNVNTTRTTTLNTSTETPLGSGANVTGTAGSMPITVTSSSFWTSVVTQSSPEINSSRTTTTQTSPSSTLFLSTLKTSAMLSNATTTFNRQVRCYDCTYFPNSDSTGTSMCNNAAGSTDPKTCFGRSCYTYAYVAQRGVVIYRACDVEGTLEFQSDDQCRQYSQVHHLTFFPYLHQCCYITNANGLPVTVCFCNSDLCNSNRSRPTKKR